MRTVRGFALVGLTLLVGCSSSSETTTDAGHGDAGGDHDGGHKDAHVADAKPDHATKPDAKAPSDAATDATDASSFFDAGPCTVGCPASSIAHLILIVQENHSFDNYFGRYCTAATGSNPTCTDGPSCCEAGPATDPSGASPGVQDDSINGMWDPNHSQACELSEMDDGLMDKYVTGETCSDPRNFAYADEASVGTYWSLATNGALADRYFQPIAGESSSNDMYLAGADFVFTDDDYETQSKGAVCQGGTEKSFTVPTIADLILAQGATFGVYAGGYAAAVAAAPACAAVPAACPLKLPIYPCLYDPADIPFEYYPSLRDNPLYMKDLTDLPTDLKTGKLPAFSFVKGIGYLSEHPGFLDTISGGEAFVQGVVDEVAASGYASSTLILVTWDESGGFFDHIAPPPISDIDNQPYGARIPLIAIGPFAKKGTVSHVQMEHSSIVTFIEWNWLNQQTGQLGTRDAVANNIGSLLDPAKTGITVP